MKCAIGAPQWLLLCSLRAPSASACVPYLAVRARALRQVGRIRGKGFAGADTPKKVTVLQSGAGRLRGGEVVSRGEAGEAAQAGRGPLTMIRTTRQGICSPFVDG